MIMNLKQRKIKFKPRIKLKHNIYNALVMSYFNYCSAVWGNINKGLADKLQKMQNRAARILTFSNCEVRSSVLLDQLGWERPEYVRLKQLAVTMYKIHKNLSPSYLRRIFTNTSNLHSHNLRNSELNYSVPRPRTESAKGSLHYRGSVLWSWARLELTDALGPCSISLFPKTFQSFCCHCLL